MPMPDDFDGIFYSRATSGDHIFDDPPEKFIAMCIMADGQGGTAQFFVAGAMADLLWNARKKNDYLERYNTLATAASQKWPELSWGAVPIVIMTAQVFRREQVSPESISHCIFRTIAMIFGAAVLETTDEETMTMVWHGPRPNQMQREFLSN